MLPAGAALGITFRSIFAPRGVSALLLLSLGRDGSDVVVVVVTAGGFAVPSGANEAVMPVSNPASMSQSYVMFSSSRMAWLRDGLWSPRKGILLSPWFTGSEAAAAVDCGCR